jgi:hypothetical protein
VDSMEAGSQHAGGHKRARSTSSLPESERTASSLSPLLKITPRQQQQHKSHSTDGEMVLQPAGNADTLKVCISSRKRVKVSAQDSEPPTTSRTQQHVEETSDTSSIATGQTGSAGSHNPPSNHAPSGLLAGKADVPFYIYSRVNALITCLLHSSIVAAAIMAYTTT